MTQQAHGIDERRRRTVWAVVRFGLGAALVAALLWWLGPDWSEVASRGELAVPWALASVAASGLATVVTAARWKLVGERLGGAELPLPAYIHALALTRFIGQFTSVLLMDLLGRGVALKAAGSPRRIRHLVAPVLVERIFDVLLPLAMLGWAVAVRYTVVARAPWIGLVAATALFVAVAVPALQPLCRLAFPLLADREVADRPPAVDTRTALAVAMLSLGRWIFVLAQFFAMGAAVGIMLPALDLLSATPVAQLTALIGITPGGLGILEAGWAGALAWLGHDDATIALWLIATRALIVTNFGILSLVTLPLRGRRPTA